MSPPVQLDRLPAPCWEHISSFTYNIVVMSGGTSVLPTRQRLRRAGAAILCLAFCQIAFTAPADSANPAMPQQSNALPKIQIPKLQWPKLQWPKLQPPKNPRPTSAPAPQSKPKVGAPAAPPNMPPQKTAPVVPPRAIIERTRIHWVSRESD